MTPSARDTFRVGVFYQPLADLLNEGIADRFERETDSLIQWVVAPSDVNIARLVASKGGKPPFDVVLTAEAYLSPAVEAGMIVRPNYGSIPNARRLMRGNLERDWGPSLYYFIQGLCFNARRLDERGIEAPVGVESLFDPRLAGHVALPDSASPYFFYNALPLAQHFGTPLDNPESFVAKFSSVVACSFYSTTADLISILHKRDIWIAIMDDANCKAMRLWGGSPLNPHMQGQKTAFDFAPLNLRINGEFYPHHATVTGAYLARGGNEELASSFLDLLLSKDALGPMLMKLPLTPTVRDMYEAMAQDATYAEILYKTPERLYLPDYAPYYQYEHIWKQAWSRVFR